MWIIIKKMELNDKGVKVPVVIIDTHGDVLEFDDYAEAEKTRLLFQSNSDSAHEYVLKEI
jgi:hypothetical protein